MTTSSTNTTVSMAASANFQAFVNEIYTGLVTVCGLTQTADTGQMAVPCVTALPGNSTVGGYYILRFNDTLQATSPVYIKLEFGAGTVNTTDPLLYITVGSSTDGAGTMTGTTKTARSSAFANWAIASTVTNYVSRYMYNATQGVAWMSYKIGAGSGGTANEAIAGFLIYRSVDNTGAPTADSVHLICNATTVGGATTGSEGAIQIVNYNTSALVTVGSTAYWAAIPGSVTTTLQGTTGQVFPVWQYLGSSSSPGWGITNAFALGVAAEIALGATTTVTVLGSTSLTYIAAGCFFAGSSYTGVAYSVATYSALLLWQ